MYHVAFLSATHYIHCDSLTINTRVPSPVVPVPGVGQVGQGLQNTWGLEEEDDGEEGNDNSGEEQEETITKMEEEAHEKETGRGGYNFVNLNINYTIKKKAKIIIFLPEATQ